MSSHPLASSPRSRNGTGYGTLKGKALKEKAARSNLKRILFPSSIIASACKKRTIASEMRVYACVKEEGASVWGFERVMWGD